MDEELKSVRSRLRNLRPAYLQRATVRRQRGVGAWGNMLLIVLLILCAVVGIKLWPMYIESFKIDAALESMKNDPGLQSMSKTEVRESFLKRLDIDNVDAVTPRNSKNTLKIEKDGAKVRISVDYIDERVLFGNLFLVAKFQKQMTEPE